MKPCNPVIVFVSCLWFKNMHRVVHWVSVDWINHRSKNVRNFVEFMNRKKWISSLFFIVWVRSQITLKRRGNVTEISILCRFFLITIKVIPLPGLVMYKGGEKRQKKSCQHTLWMTLLLWYSRLRAKSGFWTIDLDCSTYLPTKLTLSTPKFIVVH